MAYLNFLRTNLFLVLHFIWILIPFLKKSIEDLRMLKLMRISIVNSPFLILVFFSSLTLAQVNQSKPSQKSGKQKMEKELTQADKAEMIKAVLDFKSLLESGNLADFKIYVGKVYPQMLPAFEKEKSESLSEYMKTTIKKFYFDKIDEVALKNMKVQQHGKHYGAYTENKQGIYMNFFLKKIDDKWYVPFQPSDQELE